MEQLLELAMRLPFSLFFMFIHLRIMGLKELSQANALDFLFAVMLGNIAWDLSMSPEFEIWHVAAVNILVGVIYFIFDWFTARSRRAERFVLGEPRILVKDGEINYKLLEKERMTEPELRARLRCLGVFDINIIKIAYLEVSGQISVLKRGENNVFD